MDTLALKPSRRAAVTCYGHVAKPQKLGINYATAIRTVSQETLRRCACRFRRKFVPDYPVERTDQRGINPSSAPFSRSASGAPIQ